MGLGVVLCYKGDFFFVLVEFIGYLFNFGVESIVFVVCIFGSFL